MDLINKLEVDAFPFGKDWIEEMRQEVGADLLGALSVTEDSHKDFLFGVKNLFPSAKSCLVFGMEYASETMNLIQHPLKKNGKMKTGELLSPHIDILNREIDQANLDLARILKKKGYRSLSLPSRGLPFRPGQFKAPLSYSHIAEAAGMGTVGTHSFLITPEFGTRTRLTVMLTEAPIPTTRRVDPVDDCTHCLDCVKICPVQAIDSPTLGQRYKVNGGACKFYRDYVDNCGLCQKICSYATGHSEATGGPLAFNELFNNQV
jgi:epoxyqueuosine reductase QueG